MPRTFLTLLALVCPTAAHAQSLSLDGTWQFCRSADATPPRADTEWETVNVPHLVEQAGVKPYQWYRRALEIPADWQGRRMFVRFEGVKFVSAVYIDGRKLGGHAGGFEPWEVDLTSACRPGKEHALTVRVQDFTGLVEQELDRSQLKPGMRFVSLAKDSLMAPVGSQYSRGGIWQSVALLARADVYVADVFVRTSVRKHEAAVDLTLRNLSPKPQTVRLSAAVEGGSALGAREVVVPASASQTVTFQQAWPKPRLWGPEDPHLYQLVTRVEAGGRELDRVTTRFGFREFWTAGPDLVLNGTPMKFLATAGHPRGAVDPAAAKAEALDFYQRIRATGCVAMRLHANIWPRPWYEAADEVGMPLILESALFCWADSYALTKEAFWQNYFEHLRAIVRSHRNHPSIVMTSLENEILHCGGDRRVPQTESRLAEAGRIVKALDPTRPILYDGDGEAEGVADVVNLHYPLDFNRRNLWPDVGYWLETGMDVACWPHKFWSWDRKKPLYFGEFLHLQHFNEADLYSVLLGDDAYLGHGQAMARAKALAWEMQIEAYRACDLSGMVPWTLTETGPFPSDDNPRYLAVKRAYQKNAAFIRQRDCRFYAGDKVERTIYLYNDTLHPATLRCSWRLTRGDKLDAEGSCTAQIAPARKETFSIQLPMPQLAERTKAALTIQVHNGEQLVFEGATPYDVFPRRALTVPSGLRLAVFGQLSGALSKLLEQSGARPTVVERLDRLPKCDALVVAPHALDALRPAEQSQAVGGAGLRETLADFVAQGGALIVLEQDNYDCGLLPARLSDRPCSVAFRRSHDALLMAQLDANDFRFWRGDHVVARKTIRKPNAGRFRALVDSGGKEGLVYLPWLAMDHGRGRYLLCQLALGEKLDGEPAAQIVLENMLRAAAAKQPAPVTAGVVQDKLPLAESLAEIDARHEDLSGRLAAADLSRVGLLILETDSPEVAANRAKLAKYVRAGGRVILHGGTPDGLARLADLLPEPMALQTAPAPPVNLAGWDPAIDGLANQDLYWYADRKGLHHQVLTPLSHDVCQHVVVPGLPPSPAWITVEAQEMKAVQGGAQMRAGAAYLSKTATLEGQIDVPQAGPYVVAVRLRGQSLGGVFPLVAVTVGERKCGVVSAPGLDWGVAWCSAVLEPGRQAVRLSFINDEYNPVTKEDRNVVIGKLMLAPVKPLAATSLTRPSALVKASLGQGCLLIDQIRWDADCASSPHSARYLSNLLTNLGVEFGSAGTIVAGEQFQFDRQSAAFRMRDGRAYLGTTGGMSYKLRFARSGRSEFRIRASGTEVDDVFPNIALRIDGRVVGEASLRRAGWQTVAIATDVAAGEHTVNLAFTNDFYKPPKDRNLVIESLEIRLCKPQIRAATD